MTDEESWLMRDLWQTTIMNYGAKLVFATHPKMIQTIVIKRLLNNTLWEQGIRHSLPEGVNHQEWRGSHGNHKFFKTHAANAMKDLNVELLTGHDLGFNTKMSIATSNLTNAIVLKPILGNFKIGHLH